MTISTFANWIKWIFRAVIVLGGLFLAVSSYSKFRLQKDAELCDSWGAGSAANVPALVRAKSRAECIQAHANPIERIYFSNTYDVLNALPNAPCKYVGVWSRTVPGNVYRYVMDDTGKFVATRMEGRFGGDDRYEGTWGYWNGRMVWLMPNGLPWPPDVNPVVNESADQFSLREHDGSVSQFTRIDAVESKVCGTSGVSTTVAKSGDAAGDGVDTSGLLQKHQLAPPVGDWAGQYVANGSLDGDSTTQLTVAADGSASGALQCAGSAGGPGKKETGTLEAEHEWYELGAVSVNANDECRLPAHFYPLEWGGQHYLLSEVGLTYVVNQLNAGQTVDPEALLRRSGTMGKPVWSADKQPVLPKPYADGLLKTPVAAHLTGIGTVGATSPAELLKPHPDGVEYGANAALDVGSRVGVFVGMQFHTAGAPANLRIVVTKVLIDSASVRLTWRGDWRPATTLDVSTHP